uniref:Uncharacterized protein n=1 Tax=Burkholderia sp. M701 TaxID=326454 RepID=V5YN56_9BURK|nr:hypothetical protein [Burkholderia sp. M701]BAO18837.1 hypothetical protein [Burkholderia sp. M701]
MSETSNRYVCKWKPLDPGQKEGGPQVHYWIDTCPGEAHWPDSGVMRWDLRPDDWHEVWPELLDHPCALLFAPKHPHREGPPKFADWINSWPDGYDWKAKVPEHLHARVRAVLDNSEVDMAAANNGEMSAPQEGSQPTPSPSEQGLYFACIRFLRVVLWRQGAASNDVVDSLAAELASIAERHVAWANEQRGDWKIVSRAIDYMAAIHDGPWQGKAWFENTLRVLMELAVPNTGLDETSAAFLSDIQRGVNESYQSTPIAKSELRVTDEVAAMVKTLTDAGCEYGLVSDLLDLCEEIFHGEPMSDGDRFTLLAAATAAPFARQERKDRKIDNA